MEIAKVRSNAYRFTRLLGDVQAASSGRPTRIVKRAARKAVGRKYGSIVGRLLR